MRRFGKVSNHNGEGAPSEREALSLSKVCTIRVNNLVSVEYSPIRRHRLDPQRRKSSTHPAPAEFAVAFNGGPNRHQQWLAGGPPLLSWPPEYGRSFPSKKSGAVHAGTKPKCLNERGGEQGQRARAQLPHSFRDRRSRRLWTVGSKLTIGHNEYGIETLSNENFALVALPALTFI